jgi:hypothetical protein
MRKNLETNLPAPLRDDHSPAMIPCMAGSSGYPALLKKRQDHNY